MTARFAGSGWNLLMIVVLMAAIPAQEDPPISEEFRAKWTVDPKEADPRWEEAVKLRYRGDVDGALVLYHTFLEESPDEVSVVISVGTAHWEKGELDEAEKWLRKAKEMVPKHVKARQFLGKLLFDRGRFTEAQAEYEDLLALEWCPEDVRASARLNLGKLALLGRRFAEADRLFFDVGRSPERGDRASAEKGRMLAVRCRRTNLWPRERTEHLDITFSPEILAAREGSARRAWSQAREEAYRRICRLLPVSFPEPLVIYVFKDDVDAFSVSGQEEVHSFRYSWWIINTCWDRDPGHDIAHQIVSRVKGSRPANKILVEGLCCYVDSEPTDPHARARQLLSEGKLPSIVAMHADQSFSLDRARDYGESLVAFLIDTYGMEKFLSSYGWYNNVLLDPAWRIQTTGQFRWSEALSAVLGKGIGEDLQAVEGRWHRFLQG